LESLGTGSPKAGEFSVLHVLTTYPVKPHAATLKGLIEANESKHPVVTLDMSTLATHYSEEQALLSLEQRVVQAALQRKRKLDGDDEIPHCNKRWKGQGNLPVPQDSTNTDE